VLKHPKLIECLGWNLDGSLAAHGSCLLVPANLCNINFKNTAMVDPFGNPKIRSCVSC
jgi:hypothetical protein